MSKPPGQDAAGPMPQPTQQPPEDELHDKDRPDRHRDQVQKQMRQEEEQRLQGVTGREADPSDQQPVRMRPGAWLLCISIGDRSRPLSISAASRSSSGHEPAKGP